MLIARFIEANEEKKWDEFVSRHRLGSIHQTSSWGHFQEKIFNRGKYWILALEENGNIVGGSLIVRYKLPKKLTWLYMPRGPLLDFNLAANNTSNRQHLNQLELLKSEVKKLAKQQNSMFLRVDPAIEMSCGDHFFSGFKKTKFGFQPETTLLLDLQKSAEDLLAEMKPKGRYNIKLAEKKGVTIFRANPENSELFQKQIDAFYQLISQTTSRDGFSGHPIEYYLNMLKTLNPSGQAELYLAEYQNKIIAGLISTYFKDTVIYYYGASSNEDRNVMAPYLLQWQVILDAKKRGFKSYDFLGIAPEGASKHAWKGVTDFKKKFGGEVKDYISAREIIFKPMTYFAYKLAKICRKAVRKIF